MPAPNTPPWTRGFSYRRFTPYAHPGMRVSDAERSEVADRLSKHYSDGRLDETEFNERLDRAMQAKTQGDLAGLFDDLPPLDTPVDAPAPRPVRHRPLLPRILFLIIVVAFTTFVWHAIMHGAGILILLVIGFLVFVALRRGAWHHSHRS